MPNNGDFLELKVTGKVAVDQINVLKDVNDKKDKHR